MCGAGVTRLRDQSCAAPLVPASSVRMAVNDIPVYDTCDVILGGPRLFRRTYRLSFRTYRLSFLFWNLNLEFQKASINEEQHPHIP